MSLVLGATLLAAGSVSAEKLCLKAKRGKGARIVFTKALVPSSQAYSKGEFELLDTAITFGAGAGSTGHILTTSADPTALF